jgi:hypothetical protein
MKLTKRGKIVVKLIRVVGLLIFWSIIAILMVKVLCIGFDREDEKLKARTENFIKEQGLIFNDKGQIIGSTKN